MNKNSNMHWVNTQTQEQDINSTETKQRLLQEKELKYPWALDINVDFLDLQGMMGNVHLTESLKTVNKNEII